MNKYKYCHKLKILDLRCLTASSWSHDGIHSLFEHSPEIQYT